jgi:hypothetical protein
MSLVFDPESVDNNKIREFFARIKPFIEDLNDRDKIRAARQQMRNGAERCLDKRRSRHWMFRKWKRRIIRFWDPYSSKRSRLDKFYKIEQGQDSLKIYCYAFKQAARKVSKHRTESEIIEHFIYGIADRNIATTLMVKFRHCKIKSLNDACQRALLLDKVNEEVNRIAFDRAGATPSIVAAMPNSTTTCGVGNIRHKRQACQHCSRVGHDSMDCWIAFPERRPSNRQSNRNSYGRPNTNKRQCGAGQQAYNRHTAIIRQHEQPRHFEPRDDCNTIDITPTRMRNANNMLEPHQTTTAATCTPRNGGW